MKRINPQTNSQFRRGDLRMDGYIFFAYTNKRKLDGFFKEIWLSPGASQRALLNDRTRKKTKRHGTSSDNANTHA